MAEDKTVVAAPVRIARVGQSVTEVEIGDNPMTVGDVLAAANMGNLAGLDVRVNGAAAGMDRNVKPGDAVTLVPQIRGGV